MLCVKYVDVGSMVGKVIAPGLGKARELGSPAILLLETVGEVDVRMWQGC